jgi:hypothetical protein
MFSKTGGFDGNMTDRDRKKLADEIYALPLFSSHEHYLDLNGESPIDVNTLIGNSYLDEEWTFITPGNDGNSRATFLDTLRSKSYLHWFRESLQRLYGMHEELTPENWDEYDRRIGEMRAEKGFLRNVYEKHCLYEGVVQDAYWKPGGRPRQFDFFHATFRINSFLYSYSLDSEDHNGNNARRLYGFDTDDIDEYVHVMESTIVKKIEQGCVALKSALAYDRSIGFGEVDKSRAGRVLRMKSQPGEEEIMLFGDYIFHQICRIAQEQDIPFQVHTGLGLLWGSDPMNFEPIVRTHPGVRFVLFHGGYPWYHSISGLLHNYPNVYADLVWLPLISPTAAAHALHEWLEVSNSIFRIAWGSDCKTPEESYGASRAFRHVLLTVLEQKIDAGYFNVVTALDIARLIGSENARHTYLGKEVET